MGYLNAESGNASLDDANRRMLQVLKSRSCCQFSMSEMDMDAQRITNLNVLLNGMTLSGHLCSDLIKDITLHCTIQDKLVA